jgi:hypothetical protein
MMFNAAGSEDPAYIVAGSKDPAYLAAGSAGPAYATAVAGRVFRPGMTRSSDPA